MASFTDSRPPEGAPFMTNRSCDSFFFLIPFSLSWLWHRILWERSFLFGFINFFVLFLFLCVSEQKDYFSHWLIVHFQCTRNSDHQTLDSRTECFTFFQNIPRCLSLGVRLHSQKFWCLSPPSLLFFRSETGNYFLPSTGSCQNGGNLS